MRRIVNEALFWVNGVLAAVAGASAVAVFFDGYPNSAARFALCALVFASIAVCSRPGTGDEDDELSRVVIDMQPWMLDDLRRLADEQGCEVTEFIRRATAHYRQACIEGRVLVPLGPECPHCDLPKGHDGECASW